MKKCGICGSFNEDNQNYCGHCGNKLNNNCNQQQPPPQNNPHYYQNTYYTPPSQQQYEYNYYSTQIEKNKKGKGCLISGLVVVGIFVLIFLFASWGVSDIDESTNSKSTTQETTQSKSDFIDTCKEYTYKEIARNPEKYKGNHAKFKGQVIQVQENGNDIVLRVNVTAEENEFVEGGYLWEDTIYVEYTRKSNTESRILEDDIITMYGTLNGLKEYSSVMKSQVNIPYLIAEFVDINQ